MRHVLSAIAALMALSGCGQSKSQHPLVAEAEKAAVGKFGPERGVKAMVVSRTPTATDRIVCGVTKDGEGWVYTRNSSNQMTLLTKEDQGFEAFSVPCGDRNQMTSVN